MVTDILKKMAEPAIRVFEKVAPVVSRKSPEILLVGGIACIGGGVVLACRATLKAQDCWYDNLDAVETLQANVDVSETDIRKMHLSSGVEMASKFVLPVLVIGTGVTCVVVSHNIQAKRLIAAMASIDALQMSFEPYRKNVIADQGPSADLRYLTGDEIVKADFYEEDENGKVKKVKKEVKVRKGCADPYVKLFDPCNSDEWRNSRGFNLDFIRGQEVFFNRKLRLNGHVFLNEVYEALGFGYEPIGQFVGWKVGGEGDDQIVFEIEETYLDEELMIARDEKRNPEPSFWITFNVDGEIWDKLD